MVRDGGDARSRHFRMTRSTCNGGACALGHPIGAIRRAHHRHAAGARWKRNDLKRGMAALCIGGGEATAIALERVTH